MKYYVYELYRSTEPYTRKFCGYLIYNKSKDQIHLVMDDNSLRSARNRCKEILNISSQYDEDMVIWRNWPIVVADEELNEGSILKKIKEREIQ